MGQMWTIKVPTSQVTRLIAPQLPCSQALGGRRELAGRSFIWDSSTFGLWAPKERGC